MSYMESIWNNETIPLYFLVRRYSVLRHRNKCSEFEERNVLNSLRGFDCRYQTSTGLTKQVLSSLPYGTSPGVPPPPQNSQHSHSYTAVSFTTPLWHLLSQIPATVRRTLDWDSADPKPSLGSAATISYEYLGKTIFLTKDDTTFFTR